MKRALLPMLMLEFTLGAAEEARSPALPASLRTCDRFDGLIIEQCQRARLNPRLVKAIIGVESEFSPRAASPRGARGLMQLMPKTAEEMGVPRGSLAEPAPNIRAGTDYLDVLFRSARARYGLKAARLHDAPLWVQRRVLAAYNGGPRLLYSERWPRQTRLYVREVMRRRRGAASVLRPA